MWGTLGISNCGQPINQFSFGHWGIFLCAHWSPWSTFLPIHYCNGTVTAKCYYFSHPLSCNWDSGLFSHEFLIVRSLSHPFWGGLILSKVQASIFMNMETSLFLPLIQQSVNPKVWANGKTVGWAQNAVPVIIKLKDPNLFPHQKQYPQKPEVKEELKAIIEKLKEQGLFIPCNSLCNTPLLGVKKSNDEWRLVQDLWIINEAVVPFTHMQKRTDFLAYRPE